MNRRRFLTGAASLLTAPALVRASSLDYVPRGPVLRSTHLYSIFVQDQYGRIGLSKPRLWPTSFDEARHAVKPFLITL